MEVRLVPEREEKTLVIEAPALTPEVEELARRLREENEGPVLGFQKGVAVPLALDKVTRFYAEDKAVWAQTAQGEVYIL